MTNWTPTQLEFASCQKLKVEADFEGGSVSWDGGVLTSYLATVAEQNGMSHSGFKVGVRRMRKRFREELESVVLQTVVSEGDLDEEMAYPLEAMTRCVIDGRETQFGRSSRSDDDEHAKADHKPAGPTKNESEVTSRKRENGARVSRFEVKR